jgi:hypothetical protein
MGATACVLVQGFWDAHQAAGRLADLVRWIDDNLPTSTLFFFPTLWAVNIDCHERPLRRRIAMRSLRDGSCGQTL